MTSASLRASCLLAAGLLCTAALAACGSDGKEAGPDADAQSLVAATFGERATAIERAKVDARLQLEPEGVLALGGPIVVEVRGPFSLGGGAPKLDLDIAATLAGERYTGTIVSTGRRGFLTLDGRTYALGGAPASSKAHRSAAAGLQDSLGIEPSTWISNPRRKGEEQVGGVRTERIAGEVNVAKLLSDVAGGLLSSKLRKQIVGAVRSARVDVWTGAQDRILRQIAVAIDFQFPAGETPPIAALQAGKINLELRLDDVNGAAVTVAQPTGTRPLSELTGGGVKPFLAGVAASLTGKGRNGAGAQELLGCVAQAAGKAAELVRCASGLAP